MESTLARFAKMMEFTTPPGYVRTKPPAKPKLEPPERVSALSGEACTISQNIVQCQMFGRDFAPILSFS